MNAEEGASIRAVRRVYAEKTGTAFDQAPEPRVIFDIARGQQPGNKEAAAEAFRRLGEVVGDAMGNALTLLDGLAVVGGGVSGAWPLFLPALVDELNSTYTGPKGNQYRRLVQVAFNLEEQEQLAQFLKGQTREVTVPGSQRKLKYDPQARLGVGMSRLGTSEAVAVGACAFALRKLDQA
jgi:glucokinase